MRKLFPVLAGLAVLVGCDPTQKHDFRCDGPDFGSGTAKAPACVQFRITDAEALVGESACTTKSGNWSENACSTTNQIPGYCRVDSASDYFPSGTPAKVFFYTTVQNPLTEQAASDACVAGGGVWVPAVG